MVGKRKFQIPSTKCQTNSKFQNSDSEVGRAASGGVWFDRGILEDLGGAGMMDEGGKTLAMGTGRAGSDNTRIRRKVGSGEGGKELAMGAPRWRRRVRCVRCVGPPGW